jgi:predicted MFS family arabinose efflux permease
MKGVLLMKIYGVGVPEVLIILISIGIAIAFGFICKSQAAKKGYSETGFFCLGFFLGVIGLLIAFLIPSKQSEAVSNADGLLKYKELLDKGVITKEEFEAKKKELL